MSDKTITKKYTIKNCPSVSSINSKDPLCYECSNRDYGEDWRCMDRECLIKQVVEKCKKYNSDLALTGYQQGKEDFADEILQLFEIMEVE